jgi:GntR family transcriptional regulator
MIDRDGGPPPWMQLAAILRARITAGELRGMLPSEKALSQSYGVAIGTVRKAVAQLRGEGLVHTQRGWGTFTTPPAAGE